jgi:hypothetical protein
LTITRWSFWPSCGFGLALILLLRLFSPAFAAGEWRLIILVAGQVMNARRR